MGYFTGKVVVITGSSSGIGKSCAEVFARLGAKVVMAARSQDTLSELASGLQKKGGKTLVVRTDVSSEEDCRILIQKTVETFGRIDVLVNNAGISMRSLFQDAGFTVIRRLMEVNFWGAVFCTKYALPHLLENRGSVVGVSSVAGYVGLPGRTGYSASKFALHGFLESLRSENRRKGLHVLIACPGFTATNIRKTALGGNAAMQGESPRNEEAMMSPKKVAEAIARALEKRKNYLILTATGKLTVWLNKFFPAFVSRKVYEHLAKEPGAPFE